MDINIKEIETEALREITQEKMRAMIDKRKEQLLSEKWWHKFMPFQIKIVRRK